MPNRTGTYFAFDGLGKENPTESDFKYYAMVKAWNESKNIEFQCTNSHDKASAVRDTSKEDTLKRSIQNRLACSKNMLVILSDTTRKTGSFLSYEIEKAVDYYEIPLIIAYVGKTHISDPSTLKTFWPTMLATRITNKTVKAIHIPYKKKAILAAIGQFNVNNMPDGGLVYYTAASSHWD